MNKTDDRYFLTDLSTPLSDMEERSKCIKMLHTITETLAKRK